MHHCIFFLSDFLTSNNISHLVGNFFQINFVNLVLESYTSHCFLHDKTAVLEFSYKTISITHSIDNTYKYDYTEIFRMIFWIDITKLLFYFGKTIVIFGMYYSCLWLS